MSKKTKMIRQRKNPKGLATSIIVVTACVFAVAMALTAFVAVRQTVRQSDYTVLNALSSVRAQVNGAVLSVEAATRSNVWMIERNIDNPSFMLDLTHNFVEAHDILKGSIVAFRENFYKSKGKYYASYSFRDEEDGQIESKVLGSESYNYFDMDWYEDPTESRKPCWSEPYMDKGAGNALMTTYSVPLFDKDGNVYSVHTSDVSLNRLKKELEAIRPFENSYTVVMTPSGRSITSVYDSGLLSFFNRMNNLNGDTGFSEFISDEGERHTVAFCRAENGWHVALVCHNADIYRSVTVLCILMAVILIVGLVVLYLVNRYLIGKYD